MNKILIQIGSAQGNDHVTDIIKDNTDIMAILVEPNPLNFNLLKENYKDIKNLFFENLAISTEEKEVDLYFEAVRGLEHGSINYMHLPAHGHHPKDIKVIRVQAITLEQLLVKYNLIENIIDFLFIDTEGHDCDIILNTDFAKFKIKNICFESSHSDGPHTQGLKLKQTIHHLETFGYVIDYTKDIPWSLWVTKNIV